MVSVMANKMSNNGGKGNPYSGNSSKLVKAPSTPPKNKPQVTIHQGKDLRSK